MTRDRPHICFVAPSAYPLLVNDGAVEIVGGAELQQVMVARGLAARGYPVSMICLDFGQPDQVEFDGIRVFRAYRPREGIPVLRFVWPRLTKVWACLLRVQADVYYQRTAGVLTGIVAAFCQRHSKKSVFAAAGEPMIPYRRDYWIYEYGLRHVDRVFVQHAGQARFFEDHYGLSSELVPSCYDLPKDRNSSSGDEVLWVSTIRSIKRPDLFLDLAERLPQYRFTMVGGPGDRERALFDRVRSRAATLPNLRFAGFVPYAEVDACFDAAAVLVNTSETEGFPNTFLQAWSRGVPSVSFVDCGAGLEGLPAGRVVESFSAMVEQVTRLMGSPEERRAAGSIGRRYVESNHSTEHVLDIYERAFASLLSVPGGVPTS